MPKTPDVTKAARAAREKADEALAHANDLAEQAAALKEQARAAAADAADLAAHADRLEFVRVQVEELGVPADQVDADRGTVATLPDGPTYGEES